MEQDSPEEHVEAAEEAIRAVIKSQEAHIDSLTDQKREIDQRIRQATEELTDLYRALGDLPGVEPAEWFIMNQAQQIRNVKSTISRNQDRYEDGVPKIVVFEELRSTLGAPESDVETVLTNLKQRGEIYNPRVDYLRTT